jgi:DNA uptake protein ComE-like DNA-binding protein
MSTLFGAPPAGVRPPVFVSAASEDELTALPGIGRATARRIVAERARQPFENVNDFRARARVTDTQFDQLKDHLII